MKGPVRGVAGAYEREAIRPHVLGKFADMLTAVERHPAMLVYLDNAQSIGPNSKAGVRMAKGLNENLGREILELHTLGVDGGYAQEDVTDLARILTGWTVGGLDQKQVEPGRFMFAINRHEPGNWKVLAKGYPSGSEQAGLSCLSDLARHPATSKHIAAKLARHSWVTRPLPRSLLSSTAPSATPAAISAPFHVHSSRRLRPGKPALAKSCRPTISPSRSPAPSHFHRRRMSCCGSPTCSASRCGIRPRQPDGPTTTMRGWHPRPCARGSALPKASRAWSTARHIREPLRTTFSVPLL